MTESSVTETVERTVTTDAPVTQEQETPAEALEAATNAQVAIIEATAEADVSRIEAHGEADVARIEAERRNTEWQTMIQSRVEGMETMLSSIQAQLAQANTAIVAVPLGTPASTPPAQTVDPSSVQTEPSGPVAALDNDVLPTAEPPARAKRRKEVFL